MLGVTTPSTTRVIILSSGYSASFRYKVAFFDHQEYAVFSLNDNTLTNHPNIT